MSKRTTYLGTACVLAAALGAGPAAADTLAGFNGVANSGYARQSNSIGGSNDTNMWALGGVAAMPLADIPNLNWQLGAQYTDLWANHWSAEQWDFDGSVFWAGPMSRWGLNSHYENFTHFGHITNLGIFTEWYLTDMITVQGKAGYLWSGGASFGGHGTQLGAAGTFYAMPNLAITPSIEWGDIVTGGLCSGPFSRPPHCRADVGSLTYSINGEFLVNEQWPFAIYAGYHYTQESISGFHFHLSTFGVGVRWYFTGMGTLIDHHRNGNLNWFLTQVLPQAP